MHRPPQKGGRRTPSVSSRVGNLPLYADVRFHVTMTHRNDVIRYGRTLLPFLLAILFWAIGLTIAVVVNEFNCQVSNQPTVHVCCVTQLGFCYRLTCVCACVCVCCSDGLCITLQFRNGLNDFSESLILTLYGYTVD